MELALKMPRAINPAGMALVKQFEGCKLRAYQDSVNVWTIGYGHVPATAGQRITEVEAEELLWFDLRVCEAAVETAIGDTPTTGNQFSAMVSLAYNIGPGAFARSTVLAQHRAGHHLAAGAAFLMWCKAGDKQMPGLLRRRKAERDLYLTKDTEP